MSQAITKPKTYLDFSNYTSNNEPPQCPKQFQVFKFNNHKSFTVKEQIVYNFTSPETAPMSRFQSGHQAQKMKFLSTCQGAIQPPVFLRKGVKQSQDLYSPFQCDSVASSKFSARSLICLIRSTITLSTLREPGTVLCRCEYCLGSGLNRCFTMVVPGICNGNLMFSSRL